MGTPSRIVVTRMDGEELRALHLDNRPKLTLSVLADLTYQTIHPTRRRRIMGVWGQADILECLVEQGVSPKDESELNEDMVASYPVTDVDEMLLYEIALDGYGSGYAEVFIDGNEYVHVGLQFWIDRSWWSGMTGNRSKEKDVASAMFSAVNSTYEEEVQGPISFTQAFESMRWFRDETTVCVFIHEPLDTPELTLRIVNREYWDPSEEEMGLAQKGWYQNYG